MSAIQIYKYNESNRIYTFDISTFKQILSTSQDNQVAFYSITGPLRCGKSFMLSFFLKYLENRGNDDWISAQLTNPFVYKAGTVRETTGIWIWSKPYIIDRNGTKISLFLLDTQGCFDNQTPMQENATVFALSCLLSSVMIFNLKTQIEESILQFLQYFAGFARLADEDNKDEPFERLIFMIRDWDFPDYDCGYYDDNHPIDGKNYKKDSLNVNDGQPADVKFVHESILSTFKHISCVLMSHPGKDVSRKSHFDLSTVDKDFVGQVKQFVPFLLNSNTITPKKIGGKVLTGKELIRYAENWAKLFKSDKIPKLKSLFQSQAEISNDMAKCAAIDNYSRKIKACVTGKSDSDFKNDHRILFDESIKLFNSFKRLGGTEYETKYLEIIIESLKKLFEDNYQMNRIRRESNEAKEQNRRLFETMEQNQRQMNELREEQREEREMFKRNIEENQRMIRENNERMERREREVENLRREIEEERRKQRTGKCTIL